MVLHGVSPSLSPARVAMALQPLPLADGIRVQRLGFGTWAWGTLGQQAPLEGLETQQAEIGNLED